MGVRAQMEGENEGNSRWAGKHCCLLTLFLLIDSPLAVLSNICGGKSGGGHHLLQKAGHASKGGGSLTGPNDDEYNCFLFVLFFFNFFPVFRVINRTHDE